MPISVLATTLLLTVYLVTHFSLCSLQAPSSNLLSISLSCSLPMMAFKPPMTIAISRDLRCPVCSKTFQSLALCFVYYKLLNVETRVTKNILHITSKQKWLFLSKIMAIDNFKRNYSDFYYDEMEWYYFEPQNIIFFLKNLGNTHTRGCVCERACMCVSLSIWNDLSPIFKNHDSPHVLM